MSQVDRFSLMIILDSLFCEMPCNENTRIERAKESP